MSETTTRTDAVLTEMIQNFGSYLRQQRKRAGLTQRELAVQCGIDFTYISKLENGAAPAPSIQTLRRMADAFNVSDHEICAAAGRLDQAMTKPELEQHVLQLHAQLAAQTATIAALTEALGWYADEDNYNDHHQLGKTAQFEVGKGLHQVMWFPDDGKRARAALTAAQSMHRQEEATR